MTELPAGSGACYKKNCPEGYRLTVVGTEVGCFNNAFNSTLFSACNGNTCEERFYDSSTYNPPVC
jgi:hypothetical protein